MNLNAGQGVHYDWNSGKYYDNNGNEVSYGQAVDYYSPSITPISWLYFTGTADNPYQNFTGYGFADGTDVYFGGEYTIENLQSSNSNTNDLAGFSHRHIETITPDETNIMLYAIQSPFELMKWINKIKDADKLMAGSMGNISSTIGGFSLLFNTYYYYSLDNKLSIGDVARLISSSAYFLPYGIGPAYGALDIGYGINGYSLTDRFGDWVDYHLGDYHNVDPRFFNPSRP